MTLAIMPMAHWQSAAGATDLYYDEFTTAASAPLPSSRTAEPGPGITSINDTNSIMSISGGRLVVNGTAANQTSVASPTQTRASGLCLHLRLPTRTTMPTSSHAFGVAESTSAIAVGSGPYAMRYSSSTLIDVKGANSTVSYGQVTVGSGTTHDLAFIVFTSGGLQLVREATSGAWKVLAYRFTGSSTNLRGGFSYTGAVAGNYELEFLRWLQLTGAATDPSTLATSHNVNAAANTTLACNADFVATWAVAAETGITKEFKFRYVDANNYWTIKVVPGTTVRVYEKVAGVETQRINLIVINPSNGSTYTFHLQVSGTSIVVRSGDASTSGSFTSSTHQTAAAAQVTHTSNLSCWPTTLTIDDLP